ncbi:glycosyltransferase family 2 protein [Microbacterium sp. B24]|uniref:glycosyltransferase family 2 protein n=1 Tax=Microbacterium sp. B24 TaxID=95616 RepID=UPI000A05B7BB
MTDNASPGGPETRLVAVVLNWKDPESTLVCVSSLLAEPAIERVVVVDNESDGSLGAIQSDRVLVVEHAENLGFSRGVNSGIRAALDAGADWVLAINNDAVLQPGTSNALGRAMSANPRAGIVGPRVLNPDGSPQSTGGQFRALSAGTRDKGATHVDYFTWACVLVPRSTFELVGLLSEDFFMYWEDVEFGLRVKDAGLALVAAPDVTVVHELSKSHGKAGVRIDRYSAHGLTLLCLTRGGTARAVGLPYRLARRILGRIGRPERLRAVLMGVSDGRRAYRRRRLAGEGS